MKGIALWGGIGEWHLLFCSYIPPQNAIRDEFGTNLSKNSSTQYDFNNNDSTVYTYIAQAPVHVLMRITIAKGSVYYYIRVLLDWFLMKSVVFKVHFKGN